jgi:hypothetical protein
LLLEADAVAGEGDVVIGGKQGDQAENETTNGLGETESVETEPDEVEASGALRLGRFWRS